MVRRVEEAAAATFRWWVRLWWSLSRSSSPCGAEAKRGGVRDDPIEEDNGGVAELT
jgi:hypothetical protein